MAKTILGIDIGGDTLKLALCKGGKIKKTAVEPMPVNLMREGRFTSPDSVGELIRDTMKRNGIRASNVAMLLPGEWVYLRTTTMPLMTAEQLAINIPYEFNDYITDEIKNYVFDYAMLGEHVAEPGDGEEEEGASAAMDLMAVAAPKELVDEAREFLLRAGLRLVKAAPPECACISLLRHAPDGEKDKEYCFIDLGSRAIRMYIFRGERHMVTRALETGLSVLDTALADSMGVDVHLAHTYIMTDYEGCRSSETCMNAYSSFAEELMRAVNFYRFSNPDSSFEEVWLCGGGAGIEPLRRTLAETLDLKVRRADELLPGGAKEDHFLFAQAVGITME